MTDRSGGWGDARDLLVLDQLPGVGPITVRRLVKRFGSARAALEAPPKLFRTVAGAEASQARSDTAIGESVERALARSERLGIGWLTWSSPRYPRSLLHLTDPPPVLFFHGRRELLGESAVTIVGARRATSRSRDLAERLGVALARAGVVVISGLALGIDGAAHRGALSAGGGTIAVLGTGPDVSYPRAHARLFARIVESGLVLSEFLPGTRALPHHFPRRNRLLAALAGASVIVEAGAKSGALITVDHALDLGRDVWAVPGPIEHAACAGSNRLLADGAHPLLSISDFVATVAGGSESEKPPALANTEPEARLLEKLLDGPLAADEIGDHLDLSVEDVLAVLTELEMRGAVRRLPGMRYRVAA